MSDEVQNGAEALPVETAVDDVPVDVIPVEDAHVVAEDATPDAAAQVAADVVAALTPDPVPAPAPVKKSTAAKLKSALAAVIAAAEDVESDVERDAEAVKSDVEEFFHKYADGLARPITPAEQVAQHIAAMQSEQAAQ